MSRKIINSLKKIKRIIFDVPKLLFGLFYFTFKRETPPSSYQSLVSLFCATGGYSNEMISYFISIVNKPYRIKKSDGVLGVMSSDYLTKVVTEIDEKGYYIFENRLSDVVCDELLRFALSQPASMRGDGIENAIQEIYDPQRPKAVRYDFDPEILINNEILQKLVSDKSLLCISQKYLRSKPILDVVGMWWHTAYQKVPDSSSAQFFHFDMDRIKWLKFFIYITDVTLDSGPHVFVEGSHKNRGIPNSLRSKGYARLSDESVLSHYGQEKVKYHLAKRGTIIAEDTRGLHKG